MGHSRTLRGMTNSTYDAGARAYLTPMRRREAGKGLTVEVSEEALSHATALAACRERSP